jgi:hypothetical protein
MKLYITPGSPYARMARITVLEKRLEGRVEVLLAQTRTAHSPYYAINPSGRVPYLVRDDGVSLEESAVICAWLDHLQGEPMFDLPSGEAVWEVLRLEALARSLLDGLSVWVREILRPEGERSSSVTSRNAPAAWPIFGRPRSRILGCGVRSILHRSRSVARSGWKQGTLIFIGGRDMRNYPTGSAASPRGRRSWLRHRKRFVDD